MSGRLVVIDPSIAWPEDEGTAILLRGWTGDAVVLQPALRPGDGPAPGTGYDVAGVVVMGSRASALDDRPWLRELSAWLDPILNGSVPRPVFGICFGHQLIAQRAGGVVGPIGPAGAEEMGMRETCFDRCRLAPELCRMRVVASHGEAVHTLPAGYRVVASRERVPIDAFEHEHLPIFGVQFHPEARASFLAARGLDPTGVDEAAAADCDRLIAAFQRLATDETTRTL